ncbi:MAG: prolyl oligopeptidase family serine peptidase [Bryobacter sp.]|nr:prolyl oligopeptidase family serine peptidase [Bryobacter sp.]
MKTIALLLCAIPLCAAEKWNVDDLLLAEQASMLAMSPDGKLAVYVKSQIDKEKGESVSNLVLRHLADGVDVPLTRGTDNHSRPRFSKDGKRIAYLSSRKTSESPAGAPAPQGMQVWLIDTRGGEGYALTKMEQGVRDFAWLDNDTLLLVAQEDPTLYAQKVKERKDTSQVVEDEKHAAPVRLFRFDLKTKQATRLTENTDRISSLAVSEDGRWAVTTHDRSLSYVWDANTRPATFLHDLKNKTQKQLFPDYKILPRQAAFTKDSQGFYFATPYSTHPKYLNAAIDLLYYYDLGTQRERKVELDWERGLARGFVVAPGGIYASLANGVRPRLAYYAKNGEAWARQWVEGEHAANIFGMDLSDDGKVMAYLHTTSSKPGQWYWAKLEGEKIGAAQAITDLNPGWKKKPFAKSEAITWTGAKNETVEGMLVYPHNYEAGKKYPLVVMIHGGPHGADFDYFTDRWGYPHQLFAQRGAFILKPNYHGSSDYGLAWGESIAGGNYNELEWIDVETGVDALIKKGLVDPDKLGVMGWSNGSIISIELTTRTTRYKAASAGAGDVNWISDWGNCQFGHSFDDYYIGKTPLDDPQLYIKKSPLFRMKNVVTPTIIFFGDQDKQVPTEQGWQHYRALQHLGKTDVKFILFPGEAHGPRKYVHQRRKVEEELAWFDKYLFKTLPDAQEALKPESPLSALLKTRKEQSEPEMAVRGELEIARFEVTRAQFRQFDPTYSVVPGTENYPASGVSFEQAKQYAAWLAKKTGKPYRLPKEEEVKSMLKASKSENVLDAWAGYSVNVDDARRLASLIEGLGAGALLKPVGSFAGQGEDPIFDLGGNAAEWVETKDGKGKALGGSADRPEDAKSEQTPRADYLGFRVVR